MPQLWIYHGEGGSVLQLHELRQHEWMWVRIDEGRRRRPRAETLRGLLILGATRDGF